MLLTVLLTISTVSVLAQENANKFHIGVESSTTTMIDYGDGISVSSVNCLFGYRLEKNLFALGLGLQSIGFNQLQIPLYVNYKYYFPKDSQVYTLATASVGTVFNVDDYPGAYIDAGYGVGLSRFYGIIGVSMMTYDDVVFFGPSIKFGFSF